MVALPSGLLQVLIELEEEYHFLDLAGSELEKWEPGDFVPKIVGTFGTFP